MVALSHPLRLAALALLVGTATARAESATGLVVIGDTSMQPALYSALDAWLLQHGRTVVADPLDRDGVLTVANCVQLQDLACARRVVEKRSRTDGVVYAQVAKTKEAVVTVDVYWIIKGHEAIAERRACEDCTPDAIKGTVDSIMNVLAPNAGSGARLVIRTKPTGQTVVIDHEVVGTTPLERDVTPGTHEIVLMHDTRKVGQKTVEIGAGESAELTIPVDLTPEKPPARASRIPGALVLGLGVAGIAAGTILYATSQTDDGTRYMYRDTHPAGIGVGIGGVAAVGIGLIMLHYARSSDSAPVAAFDAHGGTIGWARAF
ncbi:MAG: PEGA domain-containing protein [Acidobacteriota bacterium]